MYICRKKKTPDGNGRQNRAGPAFAKDFRCGIWCKSLKKFTRIRIKYLWLTAAVSGRGEKG